MKKYNIIYADPAWDYDRKVGQGMATDHYKTMTVPELKELKVGELADKDCALICWITFPKIVEATEVIKAWGFTIKTVFATWVKTNPKAGTPFFGIGSYTKSNAEVCLLATKGKMKPYVISNKISSVVIAPRERHSKKPDIVRTMITDLFGDLPRVELFAREKYEGWDSWGNEIKSDITL